MSTFMIVFIVVLIFWVGSGIVRAIFKGIKYIKKGYSYSIFDCMVDMFWLDRLYELFYGEYHNDDDPYNFDSFD